VYINAFLVVVLVCVFWCVYATTVRVEQVFFSSFVKYVVLNRIYFVLFFQRFLEALFVVCSFLLKSIVVIRWWWCLNKAGIVREVSRI